MVTEMRKAPGDEETEAFVAMLRNIAVEEPATEFGHVLVNHRTLAKVATLLERQQAALSAADQRLGNLLARIHRDGGHYVGEYGLDKACADADEIVATMYADRDEALFAARREALEEAAKVADADAVYAGASQRVAKTDVAISSWMACENTAKAIAMRIRALPSPAPPPHQNPRRSDVTEPDWRRVLRNVTNHLAQLAEGEKDDPAAGIRGWADVHRDIAEAEKLLSITPAAISEGYVLVPREPTIQMWRKPTHFHNAGWSFDDFRLLWRDLIAVAPAAPAAPRPEWVEKVRAILVQLSEEGGLTEPEMERGTGNEDDAFNSAWATASYHAGVKAREALALLPEAQGKEGER